jgi:hypothetical protein
MFILKPTHTPSPFPEPFWIPVLERYMAGGGCAAPIPAPLPSCPNATVGVPKSWLPGGDAGCCTAKSKRVGADGHTSVCNVSCAMAECASAKMVWRPENYSVHSYECCHEKLLARDKLSSTATAAAAAAAAAPRLAVPCDGYWLVEESDAGDYSRLPGLAGLGFQANRSVCTNADDSLAGKGVSLQQYLGASRDAVRKHMQEHLIPKVRGGVSSTDLVIQDLESPKEIHPRHYGECNASFLAQIVAATRLRLEVAHDLMPNASLALYATAVNATPGAVDGYRRAAALGLWEPPLTHLVPVLYTGPDMHNNSLAASVSERLDASIQIRPRDGRELPLAPVLSWRMFGSGPRKDCAVSREDLAADLLDIRSWATAHPGRIVALQWWSGDDNEPDGSPDGSSRCGPDNVTTYLQWLRAANIVPHQCLQPPSRRAQ